MKDTTNHFSFILRPSAIPDAGVGVFALHDIAKGTHMALFADGFQEELCEKEAVPEELRIYCIDQPDGTLLCPKYFNRLDIGNFLNHSTNPNLQYVDGEGYFALCNIMKGEELFADYRELGEPEESWDEYYTKE